MFVDMSHAWVLLWHEHRRHNTPLFVEEEVHLQKSYDSVHQSIERISCGHGYYGSQGDLVNCTCIRLLKTSSYRGGSQRLSQQPMDLIE